MAGAVCPSCWANNPAGSRFCRRCGHAIRSVSPDDRGRRFSVLRPQLDPLSPPPVRGPYWLPLVLGTAAIAVGGLLLVLSAIVSWGTALAPAACGPTGCSVSGPGGWLFWAGLPPLLLGAGVVAFVVVTAVSHPPS